MSNDPVKVSVMVMTYNHGDWLRVCLESIVNQETDFTFEILIGDDGSTDGLTGEIVRRFSESHPKVVRPFIRPRNIGIKNNYYDLLVHCRGIYIAHIDGDDWMLPGKLQRQVKFLDDNPSVAMVGHHMLSYDGKRYWRNPAWAKGVVDINEMLVIGCPFAHSSKMHRRSAVRDLPSKREIVDFSLHVEHAASGQVAVIDEYLGVYRIGVGIATWGSMRPLLAQAYMGAFQLAEELGCDPLAIRRGRCIAKMRQSIGFLMSGQDQEFQSWVALSSGDWLYASKRHRVMSFLRNFPWMVRLIFRAHCYLALRRAGEVRFSEDMGGTSSS